MALRQTVKQEGTLESVVMGLIWGAGRQLSAAPRNWILETMAGIAFSTRTGPSMSAALVHQTKVPVKVSFLKILWTPFLDQSLKEW